jgi:hypothetical protein
VLHGDLMAKVLLNFAFIAEATEQPAQAQVFARRALAAACDTLLQGLIQEQIDRLCTEPPG